MKSIAIAGDLDLPEAQTLKSFYDKGMKVGFGDDDFTGMIRLLAGSNKI